MLSSHKDREIGGLYSALSHATSLLMEGVALHAVEVEGNERVTFQRGIRQQAGILLDGGDATPADMMVAAGAAIQSMEAFTRRTEQQIQNQLRELKSIVNLLLGILRGACHENRRAILDLQKIEQQLEATATLEGLRALRTAMASSLSPLARELGHPAERTEAMLDLSRMVPLERPGEDPEPSIEPLHPVTQLPGKEPAARAVHRAQAAGYWAAVPVAIKRIDTLTGRFGQDVSDEVQRTIAQILTQKLKPTDQIFHLRGAVFLMLIKRGASAEAIRAEMARALSARIEHTVTIGERTIILPLSLSWMVLPLWQQANMEQIQDQVERFAGNSSGRVEAKKGSA